MVSMTKSHKAERYPGLTVVLVLALISLLVAWLPKGENTVEIAGIFYGVQIARSYPPWSLLTWIVAILVLIACAFAGNSDWSRFAVGLSVMFLGLALRRFFPPDKA